MEKSIIFSEIVEAFKSFSKTHIPHSHRNFLHTAGGLLLVLILLQFLTGIILLFPFRAEESYASLREITYSLPFGWWIRGLHRWSSNFTVFFLLLHTFRTSITSDFLRKGGMRWFTGSFIFFTMFASCFTGYSLVGDERSFWAATVGINIAGKIPLAGNLVRNFFTQSSGLPGIMRFYIFHIIIIPAFLIFLIFFHILFVRMTGPSEEEGEEKHPFFPDHLIDLLLIFIPVLTALFLLPVIFFPELGNPPQKTPPVTVKPEWYFSGIYLSLRKMPFFLAFILWSSAFLYFISFPISLYLARKNILLSKILRISIPAGMCVFVLLIAVESLID